MLEVSGINVYYGNIHAIKNINFKVKRGEIITLIGANGAGKTTILRSISGVLKSKTGTIKFLDKNIKNQPPECIVKYGIAHVPEGRHVFSSMTVHENLEIGGYIKPGKINENIKKIYAQFPRLKERRNQLAGTLSGGEQQMLAIGRALMSEAELLMLDEPSMGLAPLVIKQVFNIIKELNKNGITIVLVEQNAKQALSIANRGYILEVGNVTKSDKANALLLDDSIKKSYLGGN